MTYYTLSGIDPEITPTYYEIIFGDYDKECVEFEKDTLRGSFKAMKIIKTNKLPNMLDTQDTVTMLNNLRNA